MLSDIEINQEKAGEVFEEGMNLIQDDLGWSGATSEEGVNVYTRKINNGQTVLKTEACFNKPFELVSDYCWTHWLELEQSLWDMVQHIDYIKEYEDGSKLRIENTTALGLDTIRQGHIYCSKNQLDENTIVLLAVTTPLDLPISENFIKQEPKYNFMIFEASPENNTHLITIDQFDPKETLSSSVLENILDSRTRYYQSLINKLKSV
jgi:hypothetical protein